jgi:AbrB family looped-hinge helix DNA binding protein
MEVAITRMSDNGQVVIPAEVRKDAGIGAGAKFIVFNHDGNIMLKQMKKESLTKDMELINSINRSETQISSGKVIKANTKMKDDEIDNLLMG